MNHHPLTFQQNGSKFFADIRQEVDQYFKSTGQRKTGNFKLYSKAAFQLIMVPILFVAALFFQVPLWATFVLFAIIGLFHALIGFNVMHDACHGSFSHNPKVNKVMSNVLSLLGSHAFIWKTKHNVIHHTYTNIDGLDDDIAKSPMLRHCPTQPLKKMHKGQHIYMFFLYGISSIYWMFVNDFAKYFNKQVYNTPLPKMSRMEHWIFWVTKVIYTAVYFVLPIYMLGVWQGIAAFLIMHFTLGVFLSIVFQLAHVVETTHFDIAEPFEPTTIENEWAVHQVITTADFATDSKIVTWATGGLNFQIEHHLFPQISHVHYPVIQKIVKRICEKYNVQYNEFPNVSTAVASHYRFMKYLGTQQSAPEMAKAG